MEPKKMETGPPALIESVVRFLTPPACREHVLGDLWERYRSRGQYSIDALLTLPFVIVSRIRRTSSAPLLAFQALSVFATFAGPSVMPTRMAVSAMVAAVATLAIRQAYRVHAPRWPIGPAMDAFAASLGAVLFSMLSGIGTRGNAWLVITALDNGVGAFVLMFCASVFWAPGVVGRPPLRRRVVYLATVAAWAAAINFPAHMFRAFAFDMLLANGVIGGSGVSPQHVLLAETAVSLVSLVPTAAVLGAILLCVARPRLALGRPEKPAPA
jgi:hypothetical protein